VDNFESLRKTLLKQFQKRMLQVIKTDEYFIAALLDPRLKGQLFAGSNNKLLALILILSLIEQQPRLLFI